MAVDDYTLGQRLSLTLRAAMTRFTITIHDLRRLMIQAREEQRIRRQPDDLKELADKLSSRHSASVVKRIENASDAAYADVTDYLDNLREVGARADNAPIGYPVALEQLAALLTVNAPPDRLAAASRHLAAASNDDPDGMLYALRFLQWKQAPPLTTRLGTALLPTLAAGFEDALAATFRLRLTLYPGEVDQRMIAVATLDRYATKDDLKRKVVDDKVRDLVAKAPPDWALRVQQDTHIDVTALGIDWQRLVEIFARRNVLAHAGGIADERYLERTGSAEVRLGEVLVCDEAYFTAAVDLLGEAAELLAIAYLANMTTAEAAPAEFASTLLLNYLQQKRRDALRRRGGDPG